MARREELRRKTQALLQKDTAYFDVTTTGAVQDTVASHALENCEIDNSPGWVEDHLLTVRVCRRVCEMILRLSAK